jgi:hypothetical protein
MAPDGQLQGDPTSPCFWLPIGEITFQSREAFDDQSIALEVGWISVMHRFGQNPGVLLSVVHCSAAPTGLGGCAAKETEGFCLGRFLRALIAQRSCEV